MITEEGREALCLDLLQRAENLQEVLKAGDWGAVNRHCTALSAHLGLLRHWTENLKRLEDSVRWIQSES